MGKLAIQVDTSEARGAVDAIIRAIQSLRAMPNLLRVNPRAWERAIGAIMVSRSFGKRKHRRGWATM